MIYRSAALACILLCCGVFIASIYTKSLSWAGLLATTVGLAGSRHACGAGPCHPRDPTAGALPREGPCETGPGLQPALAKECSCPALSTLLRAALLILNVSDLFSVVQQHWLLELPSALLAV